MAARDLSLSIRTTDRRQPRLNRSAYQRRVTRPFLRVRGIHYSPRHSYHDGETSSRSTLSIEFRTLNRRRHAGLLVIPNFPSGLARSFRPPTFRADRQDD